MHSLGIFEIDLEIKGKKYRHHINVIDQLTDNIIGIDFMHHHKMHYDVQTRQVKIAGMEFDQIVAIKEQTLPALTSTVITAKYKGKVSKDHNYIASIFSPKTPMISGMPAIVSINKNNQQEQRTHLVAWEPSSLKRTNTTTIMPFHMRLANLRTTRKTTHLFFSSQLPQSGVWMSSMNTSKVNNSSYSRITNLLKKWVICIQKR